MNEETKRVLEKIIEQIEEKEISIMNSERYGERRGDILAGIDIAKSVVECWKEAEPAVLMHNI